MPHVFSVFFFYRYDKYEADDMAPMIHRTRHPSGTRSISSQEDMFLNVLGQHIIRGEEGQVGDMIMIHRTCHPSGISSISSE